jgi:hypothetical protein
LQDPDGLLLISSGRSGSEARRWWSPEAPGEAVFSSLFPRLELLFARQAPRLSALLVGALFDKRDALGLKPLMPIRGLRLKLEVAYGCVSGSPPAGIWANLYVYGRFGPAGAVWSLARAQRDLGQDKAVSSFELAEPLERRDFITAEVGRAVIAVAAVAVADLLAAVPTR